MERVLHSSPCYELLASVASFEEIWDAAAKPEALPILAGYGPQTIGSFFSTARTNGRALTLRD